MLRTAVEIPVEKSGNSMECLAVHACRTSGKLQGRMAIRHVIFITHVKYSRSDSPPFLCRTIRYHL